LGREERGEREREWEGRRGEESGLLCVVFVCAGGDGEVV
jgi:hypothetical protein